MKNYSCAIAFFAFSACAAPAMPPNADMAISAERAVEIATAAFIPVFGAEKIQSQRPFRATLKAGVWHVFGTLLAGALGGTAEATVSQDDGRLLKVWHGQ